MSRKIWIALAAGAATLGALAAATTGPASRPRVRVDLRHGFSFVPPEGALSQPPQGSGMIAKWVGLDARGNVVAWTLTFYKARPEEAAKANLEAADLRRYCRTLQERLAAETRLEIETTRVITVAGKGAIDVVGSFALGKGRQFRRQVWVLTGPQEFLVVKVEGPLHESKSLTDLTDSVLETLRVMEADDLLKARLDGIRRGSALLTDLAGPAGPDRLRSALQDPPQWFLLRLDGEPMGFKAQAEAASQRKGTSGVQIRSWSMHRFPGKNPIAQEETLFVADGLQTEAWEARCRMGTSKSPIVETESGLVRDGRQLTCEWSRNGKGATLQREIPTEVFVGKTRIRNVHLPRAMGELLPRLVDLSQPGVYAFLMYNVRADRFDRRTFRVLGPDTIVLGGKEVRTVEATDCASDDADAVRLWLDEKGLILRLSAPGGLTMERTTRQDVLKAFPEAEKMVDGNAQPARH